MSLNVNDAPGGAKKMNAETLPVGMYPGRLVQLIDLGMQPQSYQGEEKPPRQEVRVTYELADEFMQDDNGEDLLDKPRWLSEDFPLYNIEQDKAKSTQRYNALDPDNIHEGDFTALLGAPCGVNLIHNPGKGKNKGKVYENVGGLAAMRPKDAARLPELVNPTAIFLLDDPDMEMFGKFPQFIKDKILANLEYQGSKLKFALEGGSKDESPPADPEVEVDLDDENPY